MHLMSLQPSVPGPGEYGDLYPDSVRTVIWSGALSQGTRQAFAR
jgi:hypothetical protein